jgi:hypothetical protein
MNSRPLRKKPLAHREALLVVRFLALSPAPASAFSADDSAFTAATRNGQLRVQEARVLLAR